MLAENIVGWIGWDRIGTILGKGNLLHAWAHASAFSEWNKVTVKISMPGTAL
jgi:hypothetical protein